MLLHLHNALPPTLWSQLKTILQCSQFGCFKNDIISSLYGILVNNFVNEYSRENTDWICLDNSLEDLDRGESNLEKAFEMWIDLLRSGKVVPKRIIGMLVVFGFCTSTVHSCVCMHIRVCLCVCVCVCVCVWCGVVWCGVCVCANVKIKMK